MQFFITHAPGPTKQGQPGNKPCIQSHSTRGWGHLEWPPRRGPCSSRHQSAGWHSMFGVSALAFLLKLQVLVTASPYSHGSLSHGADICRYFFICVMQVCAGSLPFLPRAQLSTLCAQAFCSLQHFLPWCLGPLSPALSPLPDTCFPFSSARETRILWGATSGSKARSCPCSQVTVMHGKHCTI